MRGHRRLDLDSPKPPSRFRAWYLTLDVRPYVLLPIWCYECQRYNHEKGILRPHRSVRGIVERVRDNYLRSPKKSTRRCSQELQPLQGILCKILGKRLRFTPYKLQLIQKLYPQDKEVRFEFCHIVQESMENYPNLLSKTIFRDEATFIFGGKVNRPNVRIWGTQNAHATLYCEREPPKENVFCAIKERAVYGHFFLSGVIHH
ncbi:hypothetical protein PoB_004052800 [Plakobranchus ocellatus]|uniref:Transposase n=1 Tax=Plakobranchus ocellatus TaxID=259542 RepID=A0AAV4B5I4_9GAST|nr:hypothetical protein PoB_004052800 [Plakobranchus ocellatus]